MKTTQALPLKTNRHIQINMFLLCFVWSGEDERGVVPVSSFCSLALSFCSLASKRLTSSVWENVPGTLSSSMCLSVRALPPHISAQPCSQNSLSAPNRQAAPSTSAQAPVEAGLVAGLLLYSWEQRERKCWFLRNQRGHFKGLRGVSLWSTKL